MKSVPFSLFIVLICSVPRFISISDCAKNQPCVFLGKNDGYWQVLLEDDSDKMRPHPPTSNSWSRNESTLHIAISSFRDRLCPRTLYNIFTKSAHPQRITVGVVQQNEAGDVDCLEEYCVMVATSNILSGASATGLCPFRDQVKMTRVSASEAQGPVWARALGSKIIENEEFCMQIDAHMDFAPDFDIHMLGMWGLTNNEYAVLSTYVSDAETMKDNMPGKRGTNNMVICLRLNH
jgi:hypothetical protein